VRALVRAAERRGAPVVESDDGQIVLVRGDAFELLGDVPADTVDLLLTDPPYNLAGYSTGNIPMSWRKSFNNDIAEWDGRFAPEHLLEDVVRVLAPTGNLFAFTSYNMLGEWHRHYDPVFDTFQFVVWHKTNPPPKLYRAGFLNSCELIVACWNKGHVWNFTRQREMHNFIEAPICMGRERVREPFHPTQKPLRVLRHLVELASRPGDVVVDPFMGVGSTGVAARELGRRFVGFEIDEGYFGAACARVMETTPTLAVDDPAGA
jgi:site-specific DNA-methyltransferase (adenine-specific)/modification methylase